MAFVTFVYFIILFAKYVILNYFLESNYWSIRLTDDITCFYVNKSRIHLRNKEYKIAN